MNNIDHLKAFTISSLPTLLKFDQVQTEIREADDDEVLAQRIR